MAKRMSHQASFKGKVALAALKENKTLSDLSQEFRIHPTQITKWKARAVQNISQIFEDGRKKKSAPKVDIEALYAQLGKLQSQLEFLKKKTGMDCG
jgi:transposase